MNNIFEIINPKDLKSKVKLIDALVPPKPPVVVYSSIEEELKGLFRAKEEPVIPIYEVFNSRASSLKNRMQAAVDYTRVNTMSIIDNKKEERMGEILLELDDECDRYTTYAFDMSQKEKKEDIFALWKHYQFEINEIRVKLEPTFEYMSRMSLVHNLLSDDIKDENFDPDFIDFDSFKFKKLNSKASCIALLHYYNKIPITILNVESIMTKYKYRSKQTLLERYDDLTNYTERINFRDLDKCCKLIMKYINHNVTEEVLAECEVSESLKELNKKK